MRKYGRRDTNQSDIVRDLRLAGCSVQDLASLGDGAPDALVGYRGLDRLMEFKTKKGKLTPDQITWHALWRGRKVEVVRSTEEALDAMGLK